MSSRIGSPCPSFLICSICVFPSPTTRYAILPSFMYVAIVPRTGAEVVTGSTRMKAGTATKMVLNMITTAAMVRLGRVQGNRMVDLRASCRKLRERATRLVREATGADEAAARRALDRTAYNVRQAIRELAESES